MGRQKIIKNIEGVPCIDLGSFLFLGDMATIEEERKQLLLNLISKERDVSALLYPTISYEEMKKVLHYVCPKPESKAFSCREEEICSENTHIPGSYKKISGPSATTLGMWHILHTDFNKMSELYAPGENESGRRLVLACLSLRYGVDLFEEFKNPFTLPIYIWEAIVYIAMHDHSIGGNVCRRIKKMSLTDTLKYTLSHIEKYLKDNKGFNQDMKDVREVFNSPGTLYFALLERIKGFPEDYGISGNNYISGAPSAGEIFRREFGI